MRGTRAQGARRLEGPLQRNRGQWLRPTGLGMSAEATPVLVQDGLERKTDVRRGGRTTRVVEVARKPIGLRSGHAGTGPARIRLHHGKMCQWLMLLPATYLSRLLLKHVCMCLALARACG